MEFESDFAKTRLLGSVAFLAGLFLLLEGRELPRAGGGDVRRMATKDEVYAPRSILIDDQFSMAPTEWRVAGAGTVEVTNRWMSDPRWTFMTLNCEPGRGKAAVLWSKRLLPGDVALEFYFAIKQDHNRGNPYAYARDVNVTIGSDGADLRKGYTFSFGGHNNTCSYVMRDGIELKRMRARIPTSMDYDRHWFRMRVERVEGKLLFKVGEFFRDAETLNGEIAIDDARPLSGDRLAIWTYENALMISRVWLSGEGGAMESPDFLPGPVRTIYDE